MVLMLPLYSLYIAKAGRIIFFIFISNYLLLYFFNSKIFSLTNILLVLMIAAATAVTVAAEAATETYIIVALTGTGFSTLFTALIISRSYPFTPILYFL